jgi:hypothetical protein
MDPTAGTQPPADLDRTKLCLSTQHGLRLGLIYHQTHPYAILIVGSSRLVPSMKLARARNESRQAFTAVSGMGLTNDPLWL